MVAIQPLVSEFTIIGTLEDLIVNDKGRVKYLYLSTPEEDYAIAVAKSPTSPLSQQLQPGCYLKVTGMRKYKLHQDQLEYKAYRIELLPSPVISPDDAESTSIPGKIKTTKPKVKVLFCQNSNCWQKGGKVACELLKTELRTEGIIDQVEIKTTGCMKQCKQAPNIVMMPGRKRYSRMQPQELSALITKQVRAEN